ncbi:MAG TPA: HTH domain-containing protein [Polyangiaceae bacterium]|nr:HTH domain-containing protein [Polyangiaceae bacterium]
MTFTEAAALVLRIVGKPLHYKEITDVAIERNLLSHVGKSPEVTMGARLNALIKKIDKDNPLVRVKPGVFALRDWDEKMIEAGLNDRTPALERVSEEALRALGHTPGNEGAELLVSTHAELDENSPPPDDEEKHRAELSHGATELFASEDDDDKPIFGSDEEETTATRESVEGGEGGERAGGKRRRRRRRGRGRGEASGDEASASEELDDDLPTYTVSDAEGDELEETREARTDAPREGRSRDRSERQPVERNERSERGERERNDRGRERAEGRREDGRRDDGRRDDGRRDERSEGRRDDRDLSLDGDEPEAGLDLADALERALGSYDRSRGPVAAQNVADSLRRKWKGDGSLSAAALLAVAYADNLRAERRGRLPRFRILGNKLAPLAWSLEKRSDERVKNLQRAAEQLREGTLRSLADQLGQLQQRAFGELVLVLLDRMGFIAPEIVRRPGAHGSELHVSGSIALGGLDSLGGGAQLVKTAVVIRRDARDIGRERVTELRGALHHYGPAAHGWLITAGQVLSGAREEAASTGATPVSLTGKNELAELCLAHGVGVRPVRIEVPTVDLELFEGLAGR